VSVRSETAAMLRARSSRCRIINRQVQPIAAADRASHGTARIGHQRGLGDLQLQALDRHFVALEYRAAVEDEARLLQLLERELRAMRPGLCASAQQVQIHAHPLEHPLAHGADQVVLLGSGMNCEGEMSRARQAPAQQPSRRRCDILQIDLGW